MAWPIFPVHDKPHARTRQMDTWCNGKWQRLSLEARCFVVQNFALVVNKNRTFFSSSRYCDVNMLTSVLYACSIVEFAQKENPRYKTEATYLTQPKRQPDKQWLPELICCAPPPWFFDVGLNSTISSVTH